MNFAIGAFCGAVVALIISLYNINTCNKLKQEMINKFKELEKNSKVVVKPSAKKRKTTSQSKTTN